MILRMQGMGDRARPAMASFVMNHYVSNHAYPNHPEKGRQAGRHLGSKILTSQDHIRSTTHLIIAYVHFGPRPAVS